MDKLRGLVKDVDGTFVEAGKPGWHAITFRHPHAGYVCGIFPFDGYVRFLFEYGATLNNPDGILQGSTKQTRHVDLKPGQPVPLDTLRGLIIEAVALGEARRSPERTGRTT